MDKIVIVTSQPKPNDSLLPWLNMCCSLIARSMLFSGALKPLSSVRPIPLQDRLRLTR